MDEGTLFSHLKKNRKLPEPEVAVKIKEIASAVKYLHENQIAHRDIKPENIVMTHVKILLFRASVSFVILVGLQFVMKEEKLIVELSIMLHLRSWLEPNMTILSICGVLECSLMSFWLARLHFITSAVNKP